MSLATYALYIPYSITYSFCEGKTILQPSNLHNVNSHTEMIILKRVSFVTASYWILEWLQFLRQIISSVKVNLESN